MGLIYLFFWPEVIHLRRRALPQPPGHVAGLAERPQDVAAENPLANRGRKTPLGLRAKTKRLNLEECDGRP